MKIIYSDETIPDGAFDNGSIFLAGPTPRSEDVKTWRTEAIDILTRLNFKGSVFIPEWSNFSRAVDYITQVTWERDALMGCAAKGKIVFWVPRELKCMPAFTTNVEFGYYLAKFPKSVLYGRPFWAPKCDYLDWLYEIDTGRMPFSDLYRILEVAVETN